MKIRTAAALAATAALALTGCGATITLPEAADTRAPEVATEPEVEDTYLLTPEHEIMAQRWVGLGSEGQHDLCSSYQDDWDAAIALTTEMAYEANLTDAEFEAYADVVAYNCYDLGYRW